MSAIAFSVRQRLRREWRSALGMAVIVAVAGATVLTCAAGAARTSSAPDRYIAAQPGDIDATVQQESGLPRNGEIAGLNSVAGVASMTFMMAAVVPPGDAEPVDAIVFAGSADAAGAKLVDGRQPDPRQPHEFVATRSLADAAGSSVGDRFQFLSLTQDQADRFGFDVSEPAGPTFEATLVGLVDGFGDGDPSLPMESLAVFSPAVLDGVDIGVKSSVMTVDIVDGAGIDELRADLDTLAEPEQFSVIPIEPVSGTVRTAVRAQANGLWILAVFAAVAAVATLGQLANRRLRPSDTERSNLMSMGFTANQLTGEATVRGAVPVASGAVGAALGAFAFSGLFPTGFAKAIEPQPGLRFDPLIQVGGAVAFGSAVVLWTWCALTFARARSAPPPLRSLTRRLAAASPTTTAATGLRFAFTRTRADSSFARAALGGVALAAAGIVAALTVGSSLGRLLDEPARQGRSFDAVFGDAGETIPSEELRRALEQNPDVAGLTLMGTGTVRSGTSTLHLVGFERLRGPEVFSVLEGRAPTARDEVALGRLAAEHLGVEVGDELTLEGPAGGQGYRVTGLAVMPSVGGGDGVGDDGLVTLAGLQRVDEAAVGVALGINLRPSAPPDAMLRITEGLGMEGQETDGVPDPVRNVQRVRAVPYLLAGVLATLGMLTVAHTLFTSARNRRHDVAVLGALGADRSWVSRVVHWQASSFAIVPILVGVPLGLVIGRQVFRRLADSLGVVNGASLPFLLVAVVVVVLMMLANVAAALPAHQARKIALAQQLHPE